LVVIDGKSTVEVYRKPTHTGRFLDFRSHNPMQHKKAVASSLYRRALLLPTRSEQSEKEIQWVTGTLKTNGYPTCFLKKTLKEARQKASRTRQSVQSQRAGERVSFATIPYVAGVSERIARVLRQYSVVTAYKSSGCVGTAVSKLKDKVPLLSRTHVVYNIPCRDCSCSYVGQTTQSLASRVKQHRADVRYRRCDRSELAEHATTSGHSFEFDKASVLGTESHWYKRKFLESWNIRKQNVSTRE
jgi:hypothetical protein